MTYVEWINELGTYLVALPEDEKKQVFSYFSEMYADKRDAGLSEFEIINSFGAPYDVAKKVLAESEDNVSFKQNKTSESTKSETKESDKTTGANGTKRRNPYSKSGTYTPTNTKIEKNSTKSSGENNILFIVLCVVLAIPFIGLVSAIIGIMLGFGGAILGFMIGGITAIVYSIFSPYSISDLFFGLSAGLMLLGLGLALAPLYVKAVKAIFKGLINLFNTITSKLQRSIN